MNWKIELTATAQRGLDRLDPEVARRAREKLEWFIENFEEITHHPLTGDYKGSLKLRVGDWRIVYEVSNFNQTVHVTAVDHRSKVYKKRR